MDALYFWKQKIVQFLHDPPSKPFAMRPGMGGHGGRAKEIFERLTGLPFLFRHRWPDWAATGADRPVLPRFQVRWWLHPYITHPLAGPDHVLHIPAPSDTDSIRRLLEEEVADLDRLSSDDPDALTQAATEQGTKALADWTNTDDLHETFYFLWRSYMRSGQKGDRLSLLWEVLPADSRCPDHSVWNHMRVTSALAFLDKAPTKLPEAQQPWLLCFSLGPVGRFLAESRTSRDLWISSFLLSDLIWHAMEPIVRAYGPDCIVYPDLHANPYVDTWLFAHHRDALPQQEAQPGTYAAVLPNTFTALIPQGDAGHFPALARLAQDAQAAVTARWQELANKVKDWLIKEGGGLRGWEALWDEQHQTPPIYTVWSAIPWMRPDASRTDRLKPWVEAPLWDRYQQARDVYETTNKRYLRQERGFDYALTHHQLRQRHALRKASAPDPVLAGARGEKCTLCGKRQALTQARTADSIDSDRQAARTFWSHELLDPDQNGAERLCAVCTMKRFLIPADELGNFNRIWAGADMTEPDHRDDDGKVRVPFPSTATLTAQDFLCGILDEPKLLPALQQVVDRAKKAGIRKTSFPRALPRLSAMYNDQSRAQAAKDFLMLEAEDVLFPETIGPNHRKTRAAQKQETIEAFYDAVVDLRQQAARLGLRQPGAHLAVVKLDGDSMGKLLLGDPAQIRARFRDIIHPEAHDRLAREQKWGPLLDEKRLTGPSLHAFISRALGHFSHRIVPWVVEREFCGRLIYAGGDDVLALVPAPQALGLCARLQQLYASAWVIDTRPEEDPWAWRRKDWQGRFDQEEDRRRFAPILPSPEVFDVQGELLPLLGPGQSLSAGILYAHYKTPLSGLVQGAEALLEHEAKDRAGRGAVALRLRSRGGEKLTCALKWKLGEEPLGAYRLLSATTEGFRSGRIPGRLPYKLRELSGLVHAARASHAQDADKGHDALVRLARGLFAEVCERGKSTEEWEAACQLWLMGLGLGESAHWNNPEAGLLLCRGLASLDAGKEEA